MMNFSCKDFVRQFFVIVLVGIIPTWLIYYNSSTDDVFFKNVDVLIVDSNIVEYYSGLWIVYFGVLISLKLWFFSSKEQEQSAFLVLSILQEAAGAIKCVYQIFSGLILTLLFLRIYLEPSSFRLLIFVVYFILSISLLGMSAFLDYTLKLGIKKR